MNNDNKINILDKQIEKAARKLNIFSFNEIANIIDAKKTDIVRVLNKLIDKGIIKKHRDGYIVVPPKEQNVYFSPNCTQEDINSYFGNTNEGAKNPEKNEIDILIDNLTPKKVTPKEIYIKNFGDIDGYYKYFVSPKEVREKILFMLKSLKHTQGKSELYIQDYCSRNDIVYSSYKQAVNLLPRFGFSLFLQEYDLADPLELYEYFKEFYLTPYNLSATEALELAHKKFEDYLDVEVEWKYFKGPFYYLRRVLKEYSTQDIRKFRKYNYSEFDLESMKLESVNKPH